MDGTIILHFVSFLAYYLSYGKDHCFWGSHPSLDMYEKKYCQELAQTDHTEEIDEIQRSPQIPWSSTDYKSSRIVLHWTSLYSSLANIVVM